MKRLIPSAVVCCAISASTLMAQSSAERLGPRAVLGGASPRVVEVQAKEPVRAELNDDSTTAETTSPPTLGRDEQLALAKVEVARRQLARMAPYNLYAQPGEAVYFEADVLPPAQQIRPVRVGNGVQRFQPDSSFSHVIQHALDNRQLATLEVDAAQQAAKGEPQPTRTAEELQAGLRLIEARRQNVQGRMQRLQSMSAATYSGLFRNLADKLELEAYDLQLQQAELLKELGNIE